MIVSNGNIFLLGKDLMFLNLMISVTQYRKS